HRAGRLELGPLLREADGLLGAAGGVVARVEVEYHDLPRVIGERDRSTAVPRQGDFRRRVANGNAHCRLLLIGNGGSIPQWPVAIKLTPDVAAMRGSRPSRRKEVSPVAARSGQSSSTLLTFSVSSLRVKGFDRKEASERSGASPPVKASSA